jgi:hypothetical protein
MPCHGLSCHQGRAPCETPWLCVEDAAAYLDEQDRRALAHHAAMNAPVERGDYLHIRDGAEHRIAPSHMGWPEWSAVAFFFFALFVAIIYSIGAFQ